MVSVGSARLDDREAGYFTKGGYDLAKIVLPSCVCHLHRIELLENTKSFWKMVGRRNGRAIEKNRDDWDLSTYRSAKLKGHNVAGIEQFGCSVRSTHGEPAGSDRRNDDTRRADDRGQSRVVVMAGLFGLLGVKIQAVGSERAGEPFI